MEVSMERDSGTSSENTDGAEMSETSAGPRGRQDYLDAEDLFYWMSDCEGADIPLCALRIDLPLGCRFCI
jgi:hypothetical protein